MELGNDVNNSERDEDRTPLGLSVYSQEMQHDPYKGDGVSIVSLTPITNSRETESPGRLLINQNDLTQSEISNNGGFENQVTKPASKKNGRHVTMATRLNDAQFCCEWNMCTLVTQNVKNFFLHVDGHVSVINDDPTDEGHICYWRDCDFITYSKMELKSHVLYHGFHAKIKGVGEVIMEEQSLQCSVADENHNVLPQVPESFVCSWSYCTSSFLSAQVFYWHVMSHVESVEPESANRTFECNWANCCWKGFHPVRLNEHSRTHTQEKIVACPKCGSLFSGVNKFIDHCCRQVSNSDLVYHCSYCNHNFPTVTLLQDHVRFHISNYKCPQCQMTCTTQVALENHIKYRHKLEKPHKCPNCSKSFKLSAVLVRHMLVHSAEPSFVCAYENCSYSCRSLSGFNYHVRKTHENSIATPYMCHICKKTFHRGHALTKHLKKKHKFQWPDGHARFRYSKDTDGYLRLQTTRYESIELAQQLMSENLTPDDHEQSNLDNISSEARASLDVTSQFNSTDPKNALKEFPQQKSPLSDLSLENNDFFPDKEILANKSAKKMQNEETSKNVYKCHLCSKIIKRGADLVRHLKNIHSFYSLAMWSKSRYEKDSDGFMRLQTNVSDKSKNISPDEESSSNSKKIDEYSQAKSPLEDKIPENAKEGERSNDNTMEKAEGDIGSKCGYRCHLCEYTRPKGNDLTKHLKKKHNFQLPEGQIRFRYIKESDGYMKLRKDCLESTKSELGQKLEIKTNNNDSAMVKKKSRVHFDENLARKSSVSKMKVKNIQLADGEVTAPWLAKRKSSRLENSPRKKYQRR